MTRFDEFWYDLRRKNIFNKIKSNKHVYYIRLKIKITSKNLEVKIKILQITW